jgi:hypothetical protein
MNDGNKFIKSREFFGWFDERLHCSFSRRKVAKAILNNTYVYVHHFQFHLKRSNIKNFV